jgi:hypothetical protein
VRGGVGACGAEKGANNATQAGKEVGKGNQEKRVEARFVCVCCVCVVCVRMLLHMRRGVCVFVCELHVCKCCGTCGGCKMLYMCPQSAVCKYMKADILRAALY